MLRRVADLFSPSVWAWGCNVLVLLLLAACGAPGQSAGEPTPASQPPETPAPQAQETAAASPTQPPATPSPQPTLAAAPSSAPTAAVAATTAPPASTATRPPGPTKGPTTAPPPTAAAGGWQTYRSAQAGYSVEYPAGWTASERAEADGRFITTFLPAGGGAGIVVIVQPGAAPANDSDIPNTRCQPVSVGGLSGTRCFDTISQSTSTTLAGQNRTFVIAAPGKGMDPAIYQHLLDSFALIS